MRDRFIRKHLQHGLRRLATPGERVIKGRRGDMPVPRAVTQPTQQHRAAHRARLLVTALFPP
ncbi:MAG: hypothetical protein ACK56I_04155, partial [bacterium]